MMTSLLENVNQMSICFLFVWHSTQSFWLGCVIRIGQAVEDVTRKNKENKGGFHHLAHQHDFDRTNGVFIISGKVEKILKGSLDLISSPSPSVKIQIMGGKVCSSRKGKTFLGIVNKLFVFKSLLTTSSIVENYCSSETVEQKVMFTLYNDKVSKKSSNLMH